MKEKTEAILKAIGVFLASDALIFGGAYILRWLFRSSIGHWLEIDKPTRPYVPGTFFAMQIFVAMIAILYYREEVRRK